MIGNQRKTEEGLTSSKCLEYARRAQTDSRSIVDDIARMSDEDRRLLVAKVKSFLRSIPQHKVLWKDLLRIIDIVPMYIQEKRERENQKRLNREAFQRNREKTAEIVNPHIKAAIIGGG